MSTVNRQSATPAPRRRWISVRLRFLILVVGAGLIILGVGSYAMFSVAQAVALDEVRLRTQALAQNSADQLDARLTVLSASANAAVSVVATEISTGDPDLDHIRKALALIAEHQVSFINIYVLFDRNIINGREYAVVWETRDTLQSNKINKPTKPFHPNLPGEEGYNPALPLFDYFLNTPRFSAARTANQFIWTDQFSDLRGVPGNYLAGVEPVYDSANRFIGVAGIDLPFGQVRTYVESLKPTLNGYAMLLDARGQVMIHAKSDLNFVGQSLDKIAADLGNAPLQQLSADMQTGKSGVIEMIDPLTPQGADVFVAYHPLETIGGSIAIFIPRQDVIGGVNQMGGSILALTGLALIAFSAISLVLSNSIVRPLVRLTQTATLISAGDLKQVAVAERNDEIGTLATTLNTITSRLSDLIDSLETRVEIRTAQIQASAEIGQAAASILDPDRLLSTIVHLITDRFGFYYAAAFLIDDTQKWAVLIEATGEGGRKLKERNHRLEIGGRSMVSASILERKPKIALDVGLEAVRFANPLLPETRSEIALPLIVGTQVLGALNVQSAQASAFDEANTLVLQSMANQIAVALNNAAQYRRERARIDQVASLLSATSDLTGQANQSALAERIVQVAARILKADETSLWLRSKIGVLELTALFSAASHGSPVGQQLAQQVFTTGQILRLDDFAVWAKLADQAAAAAFHAALAVPLFWQNQVTGVLIVAQSDPTLRFSADDENTAQLLATQVAAALANLQLLEQQQTTLHELDAVNRRLTGEAWQARLGAESITHVVEQPNARLIDLPTRLHFPIALRGQAIGALTLEDDRARTLNEDERAIVQDVIQQMTLALENQRLTDAAQQAAQRDRAIAEAADKIHRPTDLDAILQVAVAEISRIVGSGDVRIRLGVDAPASTSPANGHEA